MPKQSETQPELLQAVLESLTVPVLQNLARLLAFGPPTRKAELIDFMLSRLQDRAVLEQIWAALDPTQQAAVSEAINSSSGFDAARFRAKYGRDPDWGTLRGYRDDSPSRLRLLIYGGLVPPDLRGRLKASGFCHNRRSGFICQVS